MTTLRRTAATNSGKRNRKPITEALRRRCSIVDVFRRRKNPPVGEEHPAAVPLLVAGDHSLELRRRAVERAVAEPPLHLQKLPERRWPGVAVAAELPPPPPPLRHRRDGGSLFLLFDCGGGPPCAAGVLGGGIRVPVLRWDSECNGWEVHSH